MKALDEMNIILVQNEPPLFAGLSNVNLQITSTVGGIRRADDGQTKYVLKTRTDQRCYKPFDFLSYMRFLQEKFPLAVNECLMRRLIIVSLDSLKNRLYGVTDFFMFGNIADMKKYWDLPLDTNTFPGGILPPEMMIQSKVAEGYLVNNFFATTGFKPDWTVDNSNFFFSRFFCIIDKEQIDLFWFKYNRYFESISDHELEEYKIWQRREFADWTSY